MANAVQAAHDEGAVCYLLTLTMRHDRDQGLAELWEGLSKAWRATFGVTRWTGDKGYERKDGTFRPPRIGDAELFSVAGLARAVEVTHGANGWHLHAHVLVITTDGLGVGLTDLWEARLAEMVQGSGAGYQCPVDREWWGRNILSCLIFERWAAGLEKAGLRAPTGVGVDVRRIKGDGAEFIGAYLAKATYGAAVKVGAEVAAGINTKTPKAAGELRNRAPFEILRSIGEDAGLKRWRLPVGPRVGLVVSEGTAVHLVDRSTGEVETINPPGEWGIWAEYESASKGRAQLVWSRARRNPVEPRHRLWNRVLEARGESAEQTDEAIADERNDGDVVVVISRNGWYRRMVRNPQWITELLEIVEGDVTRVIEWMRERDVETIEGYPPWCASRAA